MATQTQLIPNDPLVLAPGQDAAINIDWTIGIPVGATITSAFQQVYDLASLQEMTAAEGDLCGVQNLQTQHILRGSKLYASHQYLYLFGIRLNDGEVVMDSLIVRIGS